MTLVNRNRNCKCKRDSTTLYDPAKRDSSDEDSYSSRSCSRVYMHCNYHYPDVVHSSNPGCTLSQK